MRSKYNINKYLLCDDITQSSKLWKSKSLLHNPKPCQMLKIVAEHWHQRRSFGQGHQGQNVMNNGCLGSTWHVCSTNKLNVQWQSINNSCTFLKHNIYNSYEPLQHDITTKYKVLHDMFILQLWVNDLSRRTQHPVFLQKQTPWSVRTQTLVKIRHTHN
jgi:hypothetical protein